MQTFTKNERLRSKKIIDRLFREANVFFETPFKVFWQKTEDESDSPTRILISVSKRKIAKAVNRNLLKRRIREAYRKNKSEIYEELIRSNQNLVFALVYLSGKIASYNEIEEKIILILQRLQKETTGNIAGGNSGTKDYS
ncbi:MAG: ribonuclease P protein component [Bacteroidales bacterium]|nr:ribonuclease P protein component [Bacteroidales bacterium]